MPVRVFLSYAHDNEDHKAQVLRFCGLLRKHGIDARVDRYDTDIRRDWHAWATEQITAADYVLAVASPEFRHVGDGNAAATRHRGAQSEAALLRDLLHSDRPTWTQKLLPIVLPGNTIDDIPHFVQPYCADHYVIPELSLAGIEHLLRTITGQPRHKMPDLGDPPDLPPEDLGPEPEIDVAEITRRIRGLDPQDAAAALINLTPAGATRVLVELHNLDEELPAELLDETDPTFAAEALYRLIHLREVREGFPSDILEDTVRAMRPERAIRLLVMIRNGQAGVPTDVALTLLGFLAGSPTLNTMDPDTTATMLLDLFDDDVSKLPGLLGEMEKSQAVTVLARLTHEHAADLLTGIGHRHGHDVNAKLLTAMAPEQRTNILGVMGPDMVARALEEMNPADGAEILRTLPESSADQVLRRLVPGCARQIRVEEGLAEMRQLDSAAASTFLTGLTRSAAAELLYELDVDSAADVLDTTEPAPAAAMLYELGKLGERAWTIMELMRPEQVASMIVAVHENRTELEPNAVLYFLYRLTDGSGGPVLDTIDAGQVATMLVTMARRHSDDDQPAKLLDAMTPDNAAEVIRRMGVRDAASVLSVGNNSWVPRIAAKLLVRLGRTEVAGIIAAMGTDEAVRVLIEMEPDAAQDILGASPDSKAHRLRRRMKLNT